MTTIDESVSGQLNTLLTLDRASTVALTVDMQREYLDPAVGFSIIAADDLQRVVAATTELLGRLRRRQVPVVHCYVKRRPQEIERGFAKSRYSEIGKAHGILQNQRARKTDRGDRVEGTPESELLGVLGAHGDAHVTTKKTMDCFFGTDLDQLLRRAYRAEAVVITGINTDSCVYSTAFSASNHGYLPIVVEDCCASMRGSRAHESALELMGNSFAWVLDGAALLGLLDAVEAAW